MSKKNNKRWWWNGESVVEEEGKAELFSNTIRQHDNRLNGGRAQKKLYDENGNEVTSNYLDDEDVGDYYGWGRRQSQAKPKESESDDFAEQLKSVLGDPKGAKSARTKKMYGSQERLEFANEWDAMEKTGSWYGYSYYRRPTLSYRYVQQVANSLAAQHKIGIKVGNDWDCDLDTKTLTYNPASLVYSSKSELLATLLHEIGKLRYSVSFSNLTPSSPFMRKYGVDAYRTMMPFEELRVDHLMLQQYGSAGEIYESQEPTLQKVYGNYKKFAAKFREVSIEAAMEEFKKMVSDVEESASPDADQLYRAIRAMGMLKGGMTSQEVAEKILEEEKKLSATPPPVEAKFSEIFGVKTKEEALEMFKAMARDINAKDTIYDYIAAMYNVGYLLNHDAEDTPGIEGRVKFTEASMDHIPKRVKDAHGSLSEMDNKVYPVVEDLLEDAAHGFKELERFGPGFRSRVASSVARAMAYLAMETGAEGVADANGKQRVRMPKGSGPSDSTTVPEWFDGDYKVLKESVRGEISRLTRMLTFLRRTEQVVRWVPDQRRGRLDTKKLYKVKTGARRVFKKKLESQDTVRSFAFSMVLDVSGSMSGARIANTTRGLVILAEVFKEMQIPFELITFSDGANTVKSFDQPFDKSVEKRIGGLPRLQGGGTNLNRGLELTKLKDRSERNKVMVVLTDGGVGDPEAYNSKYFDPMLKKDKIKSVAFGLETSGYEADTLSKLCNGTGRNIDNASEVPYVFADLLKKIIMKR